MSSTVQSRPDFYALLGLRPAASAEEITRAFAREIASTKPRAFGGLAAISVAYETLRDPAKRRAYDDAIGVRREPPKPPIAPYVTNAMFVRPAAARYVSPSPAREPEPRSRPQPQPEPVKALASPIEAVEPPQAEPATPRPFPKIAVRSAQSWLDGGDRPADLNRTVGIVASLALVVAIGGAWAGAKAGEDATPVQPKSAVTTRLPKAQLAQAPAEVSTEVPAAAPAKAQPVRPPARRAFVAAPPQPEAPVDVQPVRTVAEQNQFARDSIAQALAVAPAATDAPQPVAASMPLSERTVARTIDHIGFRCGSVSSTTAGEGAGVFNITCSSGQRFEAKPVGGRYRFRRTGR